MKILMTKFMVEPDKQQTDRHITEHGNTFLNDQSSLLVK